MQDTKKLEILMVENRIKDIYRTMLENNSHFASFVQMNKDKSLEEIMMEYDINLDLAR